MSAEDEKQHHTTVGRPAEVASSKMRLMQDLHNGLLIGWTMTNECPTCQLIFSTLVVLTTINYHVSIISGSLEKDL